MFKCTPCDGVVPFTQIYTEFVYKINMLIVAAVKKFMKICKIGELMIIFSSQICLLAHSALVPLGSFQVF